MSILEQLKALEAKATQGPWTYYDDSNDGKTNRIEIVALGKTIAHIYHSVPAVDGPNASLIAALRNNAKALIACAEACKLMDDLIAYQYTGSREAMTALQITADAAREALRRLEG